jgi:hypothetical protein
VLTKTATPQLFKLPRSVWQAAGKNPAVLQPVRQLPTNGLPTDMAISDAGDRFLSFIYTNERSLTPAWIMRADYVACK